MNMVFPLAKLIAIDSYLKKLERHHNAFVVCNLRLASPSRNNADEESESPGVLVSADSKQRHP